MSKILLLFFGLVTSCLTLSAQTMPDICGDNPSMTPTCALACVICDIDGFSGINDSPQTGFAPPDFCAGQIHNVQWIGFIAGTEDLTLAITVTNCGNPDDGSVNGLQIGLYESLGCEEFQQVSNCDDIVPNNTTTNFVSDVPLVPGQYYYLVIDGAFGDICNYEVNVTNGSTLVPDIFIPADIESEEIICPGYETQFSASTVVGATEYEWTVDGQVVGNEQDLSYTFPQEGGAYTLCVTAKNVCSTGPPSCEPIILIVPPPAQEFVELCLNECIDVLGEEICSPGVYPVTLTDQDGCDSLVNVVATPLIFDVINTEATICEGEEYEFGGQILTEEGGYTEVFTNQDGCDSTIVLVLTVTPAESSDESATICAGDSYEVGEESFTETGMYEVLVPGDDGECASVVNLDLTVIPTAETFLTEQICQGDSYEVGTESFTATGMYDIAETDAQGCESVTHLELTVLPVNEMPVSASICEGQSYEIAGQNFTAAGMYDITLEDENGCDSIINLTLSVTDVLTTNLDEEICAGQSYAVGTQSFNTTGMHTVTLQSAAGCDSIVNLDLEVVSAIMTDLDEEICAGQSYAVGTQSFNTTGLHTVTLQSAAGCDSIVNLDLEVVSALMTDLDEEICAGQSYEVGTQSFNTTGMHTVTLQSAAGCDSIVNLDLEVVSALMTDLDEEICAGQSYEVGGVDFSVTGEYTVTLQSAAGCDSIVNLDLEVVSALITDLDETLCPGENYEIGTETFDTAGEHSVTLTSAAGCDSIVNLNLDYFAVPPVDLDVIICNGQTYTLGTEEFSATGDYPVTLTSSQGCDSLVNLSLTVVNTLTSDLEASICAGDSYELGTESFSATGMYDVTFTSQSGCDSIVTLDLEVINFLTTDLTETVCAGGAYEVGTETFTATGMYNVTLTAAGGCDSLVNLDLTVLSPITETLTEDICAGESVEIGTETFTATGDYTVDLTSVSGCDSTVFLSLTVTEVITEDLEMFICEGEEVEIGTETFDTSGEYQVTLPSSAGCDSLVNLDLTVYPLDEATVEESICAGESVFIGDEEFTAPGEYIVPLLNANGCDSTVILLLDVSPTEITDLAAQICADEVYEVSGETFDTTGEYVIPLITAAGCDSTVNLSLTVLPDDSTDLTESICLGETFTIGTETFDTTGEYTVTLQNQNGCDSLVTLDLTVAACDVSALIFPQAADCFGEATGSFTLRPVAGNPPFSYTFNGEGVAGSGMVADLQEEATVTELTAGVYSIVLTDAEGLEIVLNVQVTEPPVLTGELTAAQYGDFNVSCPGENDGALTLNPAGGTAPYTFQWITGATGNAISGLPTGAYTATLTDANGCTRVFSEILSEPSDITFNTEVVDPDCLVPFGSLAITEISGGTEPYTFAVADNPASVNPDFIGLAPADYTVTVEDANGCQTEQTINIPEPEDLFVDLGRDENLTLGDSILLQPDLNFTADSIVWEGENISCDSCLQTYVSPTETTDYLLTVYNDDGCFTTEDTRIVVDKGYQIFVPNAFSPGNDGVNEVLVLHAGENVKQILRWQIFSRWGEPVHEFFVFPPNDETFGWNGTYRNQVLNDGVFVWIAEVEFTDGHREVFRGDVTLLK